MRPRRWMLLMAVGFAVMVVASAWAPSQPELIDTGAACQAGPCGTLEDPGRWRRAWWLWAVGVLIAAVGAAFVVAPRRLQARAVLLLLISTALAVVPVGAMVLLLSALTSVQGVATAAVLVPLVVLAVLGSWVRWRRSVS